MKLLYLPIEILDRELPAKLLIAIEAMSKGFAVCLIEQNELKRNLKTIPAGAIIHKDHADCNAYHIFKVLKKRAFLTCSLDEEGLVYFNKEHFARARIGKACMTVTDLVFSWGQDQHSILEQYINQNKTTIVQTGNPRFDIHVSNRKSRQRYQDGNKILINTRFGSVNSGLNLDVDGYIERMKTMDEVKTLEDENFRRLYFYFMQKLYGHFLLLIETMAKKMPEYKITVRPHPAESAKPYVKLSKQFNNIIISKGNTLEEDLLSHDVLIHNGCTTGIEAIVTHIPTIVFEPISAPEGDMALPNHFGLKCQTIDDVIHHVRENNRVDFDSELARMGHYIASLEHADAHKKIVKAIDEKLMLQHENSLKTSFQLKKNYAWHVKNMITWLPDGMLFKALQQKKLKWQYVAKKFPILSAEQLLQSIDKLINNETIKFKIRTEEVVCRKVGVKAFILYQKEGE